LSPSK